MSMPNIPNVEPIINIDKEKSIDLLLASIAFEDLGLAHIINAEAEKVQFILGTLERCTPKDPPTIRELLKINKSVEQMMKKVIEEEIILEFKLEDIAEIPGTTCKTKSMTTTSTTSTTTTTTATRRRSHPTQ